MNETIKNILLSISKSVYLFTAKSNAKTPYLVYGVDGDNSLHAGNSRVETVDSGYIDLFTKKSDDPLIKDIPAALDAAEVSFYLNSVQFENETNILHYEWRWECGESVYQYKRA